MYVTFLSVHRRLQKKNEDPKKPLGPKADISFYIKNKYMYGDVIR